jgi:hypothetical protein
MSVRLPLDAIGKEWDSRIEQELTFYPKVNTNLKHVPDPVPLTCYRTDEGYLRLPLRWALDNVDGLDGDALAGGGYADNALAGGGYADNALAGGGYADNRCQSIECCPRLLGRTMAQQEECDEVIDTLLAEKTATLTIRTGGGKTFIFLTAACALRKRTLVLIWIDGHTEQIINSIIEFTTATYGSVTLKGLDNPDADIVVCLYTRWKKLTLEQRQSFGFLVVDELHLFYNRSGIDAILAFQPDIALGCTATPENKRSGMHVIAYPIFGKNYVSRAFDIPFNVTKVMTGITGTREKSQYLKRGVDYTVLAKSFMYNPVRNGLLADWVVYRLNQGDKILVVTEEKQQTIDFYELLRSKDVNCDYVAGKKKKYVDSSVLVGIVDLVGVGFDEKTACPTWNGVRINRILLLMGINAAHLLLQIFGRSLRSDNPAIDHIVDDDSTSVKQFNNMLEEVYIPLGGTVDIYRLGGS